MLLWPDGSCMLLVLEEGPGCGILLQLLRMELVSPEAAWAGDAPRRTRDGRKAILQAPQQAVSMRKLGCPLRGWAAVTHPPNLRPFSLLPAESLCELTERIDGPAAGVVAVDEGVEEAAHDGVTSVLMLSTVILPCCQGNRGVGVASDFRRTRWLVHRQLAEPVWSGCSCSSSHRQKSAELLL